MTETHEPFGEVGIGQDKPQVTPKTVVIEDYKIESVTKDNKEIGKKVILLIKHPDINDRLIKVSGAKYEHLNKIKCRGIWWKEDSEGKIPFNSALANVLRHVKKPNLKELMGCQVDTVTDENNYLVIKAY